MNTTVKLSETPITEEQAEIIGRICNNFGFRHIHCKHENGVMKRVCYHHDKEFAENIIGLKINKFKDYYITSNTFRNNQRNEDNLLSLDNIVIDIDCHNTPFNSIDYAIDQLFYYIYEDYNGYVPQPSIINCTGRGVQLWYHFEETASSMLLKLFKTTAKLICDRFSKVINDNNINLSVDYSASCNLAGLFRLPYSYNSMRIGYCSEPICTLQTYQNIDELIQEYDLNDPDEAKKFQCNTKIWDENLYTPLHIKRLDFLEKLCQMNNGRMKGRRNTILFLYYNAAVQVYPPDTAVKMVNALNNTFTEQYSNTELKTIIKAVNKKIYHYSNQKFAEILNLSESESYLYTTTVSSEDYTARIKKIKTMAFELKTIAEIANEVKLSERSVKTILKRIGFNKKIFTTLQVQNLIKNMTVEQVAKALNISERSVYRHLKYTIPDNYNTPADITDTPHTSENNKTNDNNDIKPTHNESKNNTENLPSRNTQTAASSNLDIKSKTTIKAPKKPPPLRLPP